MTITSAILAALEGSLVQWSEHRPHKSAITVQVRNEPPRKVSLNSATKGLAFAHGWYLYQ